MTSVDHLNNSTCLVHKVGSWPLQRGPTKPHKVRKLFYTDPPSPQPESRRHPLRGICCCWQATFSVLTVGRLPLSDYQPRSPAGRFPAAAAALSSWGGGSCCPRTSPVQSISADLLRGTVVSYTYLLIQAWNFGVLWGLSFDTSISRYLFWFGAKLCWLAVLNIYLPLGGPFVENYSFYCKKCWNLSNLTAHYLLPCTLFNLARHISYFAKSMVSECVMLCSAVVDRGYELWN